MGKREQHGPRHAEHVTDLGTRAHEEVLHDVGKGFPAFENAGVQRETRASHVSEATRTMALLAPAFLGWRVFR
jgi:hypothetical protein